MKWKLDVIQRDSIFLVLFWVAITIKGNSRWLHRLSVKVFARRVAIDVIGSKEVLHQADVLVVRSLDN